jgi:hypothetical protein
MDRRISRMEAHARGHVEIEIGVVHAVESPARGGMESTCCR